MEIDALQKGTAGNSVSTVCSCMQPLNKGLLHACMPPASTGRKKVASEAAQMENVQIRIGRVPTITDQKRSGKFGYVRNRGYNKERI